MGLRDCCDETGKGGTISQQKRSAILLLQAGLNVASTAMIDVPISLPENLDKSTSDDVFPLSSHLSSSMDANNSSGRGKRKQSLNRGSSFCDKRNDYRNGSVHPMSIPLDITLTNEESDRESVISDYLTSSANRASMEQKAFLEESSFSAPKDEPRLPGGPQETVNVKPSTTRLFKEQIISFFQPSDNKLAMKLFGNKSALLKEKMRQKATGNWVIHPCSNFRFYWDLIMLLLLIANLIILPVAISYFNDDLSLHWIIFNCASDTIFLVDIAINFRTGVIREDLADPIILAPKEIAIHYVKTWFFLDLLSSIPMDYIFLMLENVNQNLVHAGRALRILRLAKLLSLLRLLRLSRLVRYIGQWEEFFSFAGMFMRIFNLICLMLLLGHWNGCLQFLVPMLQDFPADSWVAINELQTAAWTEQYTWSLFKALSHMLCIGYGRWPPRSAVDVWLTIISMLTGATCYALFVGHATTLIQSFDTSSRLYRDKYKQVEEYMAYRKLPRPMRSKIADYYQHRFRGKIFDEEGILLELNGCLREEVVNYNCRSLVANVPFFTNADPCFVSQVISRLQYEVFQPSDYIIKEGTIGDRMYFIQEGIVDIITKDGEVATSLADGSYFGEICLLTNSRRVASVRAETYCNLFCLTVEHFHDVLSQYPVMRRTLESVAAQRLSKIGASSPLNNSYHNANFMDIIIQESHKKASEIKEQSTSKISHRSEDNKDDGHDDLVAHIIKTDKLAQKSDLKAASC